MTENDIEFLAVMIATVIFIIGVAIGHLAARSDFKKEAVSEGVGQYNSETGKFEWKK